MDKFIINKNKNFTIMSNIHLRDKDLTLKAKGLLSFMLSLPDDWDYSLNGLVKICKESKDAIRSALYELKTHYYLDIRKLRGQNGLFEYEYIIYENPSENPLKMRDSPDTDFPDMDHPDMENPPQINTKEQNTNKQIDNIDKIDKTINGSGNDYKIEHSILTLELIRLKYIGEDDSTSFYYDSLFKRYLSEGHNYKELYSSIHYIVSRVKERNYRDEDGNIIENKYGYFKNSLEFNFNKFELANKDLYSDEDLKETCKDFEER